MAKPQTDFSKRPKLSERRRLCVRQILITIDEDLQAKIAGCTKIIAVGGNSASLRLALELGATHVINRRECGDIPGKIREITGGGAHYSIDTTGVGDFVKKALACLRFLGVCVTLAGSAVLELNIQEDLMGDAKSLVGIVEGDSVPKLFIPILLDYYRQGKFPFDRLIRFYDFQDINQAFEDSHSGKTIKAVLKM